MGFIREPQGVDFVISPSQTAKEDVGFISNYIQQHKTWKDTDKQLKSKTKSLKRL